MALTVPVATAVVCNTMFSCAVIGVGRKRDKRYPMRADWSDILSRISVPSPIFWDRCATHMLIQPVWRPKYRFVKHSRQPMSRPRAAARNYTIHDSSVCSITGTCHHPGNLP